MQLVGVFDPDKTRRGVRRQKENGFSPDLLFTDLGKMLDTVKPEAVATTSTFDHAMVVEMRPSPHPVMMEKPLAVDVSRRTPSNRLRPVAHSRHRQLRDHRYRSHAKSGSS